jgi:hypothetical protein
MNQANRLGRAYVAWMTALRRALAYSARTTAGVTQYVTVRLDW